MSLELISRGRQKTNDRSGFECDSKRTASCFRVVCLSVRPSVRPARRCPLTQTTTAWRYISVLSGGCLLNFLNFSKRFRTSSSGSWELDCHWQILLNYNTFSVISQGVPISYSVLPGFIFTARPHCSQCRMLY